MRVGNKLNQVSADDGERPIIVSLFIMVALGLGLWGLCRSTGYGAEVVGWWISVISNITILGGFFWATHEGFMTGGWLTAGLLGVGLLGFVLASGAAGPAVDAMPSSEAYLPKTNESSA